MLARRLASSVIALALAACSIPAPAADQSPLRVAVDQLLTLSQLLQGGDGFVISPLSQGQFESLAGDVAAAVAMPGADAGLPPAHGHWRVSLGGSRAATGSPQLWQDATGDRRTALYAPQVLVEVGIGGRAGLGASYGTLPGSDAALYGLRGSLLLAGSAEAGSALALRSSHTLLRGVDGLDARATTLDVLGSWGSGAWRPFAGVGLVHGRVAADGDVRYTADTTLPRAFAGLEYTLGALRLGAEIGTTEGRTTQALRLSLSFD